MLNLDFLKLRHVMLFISDEKAHMCRQKGKNSCTAVYIPILVQFGSMKGLYFSFQEQKTKLP